VQDSAGWTLDELVERVAAALAGTTYPGAPNGRVRDLPDRRAIRWYTTIGLVDRPAGHRGRTALYGPRHLLQLVAVKRLQANGESLTRIQATLTGATDAVLRRIARVPTEAQRPRFWAQRPVTHDGQPPVPSDDPVPSHDTVTTLTGVALPGGAVLLLPAGLHDGDLDAIVAASRPLLDLLADRGLISSSNPQPHHAPRRSAR
jgi:MerR HTH family regulatory protein